jgi:hypothetical protein
MILLGRHALEPWPGSSRLRRRNPYGWLRGTLRLMPMRTMVGGSFVNQLDVKSFT